MKPGASMDMPALSFVHRFVPGNDARAPLLLLHGTGGNENDLLPLGAELAPGAALLSLRGQVLEHGMPRFFRRLAEGVFDEADVVRRADDLARFVAEARTAYGIAAPIALGFSNGANIAAALLMLHPESLTGAVLLRAMTPLRDPPRVRLAGKKVLMLNGAQDPMAPMESAARLAAWLDEGGADVTLTTLPGGHGLGQQDLSHSAAWLERHR
jgi:phospholipase/carboxylesterase